MPESIRDESSGKTVIVNSDGSINTVKRDYALTVLTDFDGGNFPIYIGEALPGTDTGDLLWRIQKRTYTDNKLVAIKWADGSAEFVKEWDERATYTYS